MKIELVVFDVAGTTVRDEDVVLGAVMHAFARHDLHPDPVEVNRYMGIPKPEMIARFVADDRSNGNGSSAALAIHQTFLTEITDAYRDGPVAEIPGARETFVALRERGIKVALDTGFERATLDLILARLGWDDGVLDCTVASDEVARGRPFPFLIFRAMERCGISAVGNVAKVGDTPADIREGHAAGCGIVAAVLSGSHDQASLASERPTDVLNSVVDVLPLAGIQA